MENLKIFIREVLTHSHTYYADNHVLKKEMGKSKRKEQTKQKEKQDFNKEQHESVTVPPLMFSRARSAGV